MNQFFFRLIQGALIGAGAILPGVSGGMLCLMFGIYEPMMELLSRPCTVLWQQRRLFIPLMLGGILGFFVLASGVERAFAQDSAAAACLFLGLIAGSLPPLMMETGTKPAHRSLFIACFLGTLAVMISASSFKPNIQPSPGWFLFCGAVWGLSLILPGLSSSTILIFLGLYQPMTAGIAAFDPACILPVGAGIGLTTLLCAPLVRSLLERHRSAMLNTILGTMCASAVIILPADYRGPTHGMFCLLCALTGFGCAVILEGFHRNMD